MLCLAGCAMAELAVQWLLTTQLVLDLAAVAACFVSSLEVVVRIVNLVWCSLLPL